MFVCLFLISVNMLVHKRTIWPQNPEYDRFGYSLAMGSGGNIISIGIIGGTEIYASISFDSYLYFKNVDEYHIESSLILRAPSSLNSQFPINPHGFGLQALMNG